MNALQRQGEPIALERAVAAKLGQCAWLCRDELAGSLGKPPNRVAVALRRLRMRGAVTRHTRNDGRWGYAMAGTKWTGLPTIKDGGQ